MQMNTRPGTILALLFGVLLATAQANAQEMRPGLWEYSFTMQSQSGELERSMREMQRQLENMPPEQRRMMEQMMADQGMQMGANTQTIRICVSEEQAARGFVPQQDGEDCTQEIVQRSGNTIQYRFNCPGNPPTRGEGELTLVSPTAFKGTAVVNTTVNGQPERMTLEQEGKWLSSDCGALRPR